MARTCIAVPPGVPIKPDPRRADVARRELFYAPISQGGPMHRLAGLTLVVTLAGSIALRADAKRWWSHVEVLADDAMEGRNTGSAGHKRAADYVAGQFKQAGLEPGATGGSYIQPVAFKTRRLVESASQL